MARQGRRLLGREPVKAMVTGLKVQVSERLLGGPAASLTTLEAASGTPL